MVVLLLGPPCDSCMTGSDAYPDLDIELMLKTLCVGDQNGRRDLHLASVRYSFGCNSASDIDGGNRLNADSGASGSIN